jgi:hypothetical protein
MKKYNLFLAFILIVLAGYFLQPITPWWSIALISLVIVLLFQLGPSKSMAAGFFGGFLLWGLVAFLANSANEGILAGRIGNMLGGMPGNLIPLLSAIVGGITAGLGALLGSLGRGLLKAA